MLVVTTDAIPGCVIRRVLGEVHGVTARPRNPYAEGVKDLDGAMDPHMPEKLGQSRDEAVAIMSRQAYRRGANAVVGMRFDHRDVGTNWTEICAYGTAVLAVPAQRTANRPDGAGPARVVRPRERTRG